MKSNKKLSIILIAVLVLVLTCALVLCACNKKTDTKPTPEEGTTTETPTDTDKEPTTEPTQPVKELSVSFDEGGLYTVESLRALDVALVTDGVSRSVDYSVKNSTVSEDGTYIDVVIVAEGMEKSIRLPYCALNIRTDLLPLYSLLSKEGDKFVKVGLNGSLKPDAESEASAFNLQAIANIFADEDKDGQYALISVDGDKTTVLAVYNNEVLSVGGFSITKAQLQAAFANLFDFFAAGDELPLIVEVEGEVNADKDLNDETGYEADPTEVTGAPETDATYEEEQEKLDLGAIFEMVSAALNKAETVMDNPLIQLLPVELTAKDGVYTFSVDSKTLLSLVDVIVGMSDESEKDTAQETATEAATEATTETAKEGTDDKKTDDKEDEASIDWKAVIDALDAMTDGALKEGAIQLSGKVDLNNGIAVSIKVENTKSGLVAQAGLTLEIGATAYEMPAASTIGKDLAIDVNFQLPQNELNLDINTIINIAAILGEGDNTNYATITVTKSAYEDVEDLDDESDPVVSDGQTEENVEDVEASDVTLLQFVLDEHFAYLDASGLFSLMIGADMDAVFYDAFTIDGQPATLQDVLPNLLTNLVGGLFGDEEQEEQEPQQGENNDTEEGDDGNDVDFDDDGENLDDDDGNLGDDDGNEDYQPGIAADLYMGVVDDQELIFPIGTTEDDLRAAVYFFTTEPAENEEEDDIKIPYEGEYTIVIEDMDYENGNIVRYDFDNPASYKGNISFIFEDGSEACSEIIFYDPQSKVAGKPSPDSDLIIRKGSTIAEVEAMIGAMVDMTDGVVSWTQYLAPEEAGYAILSLASDTGVSMANRTEDFVFDTVGEYMLFVGRNGVLETMISARVYDPDNLQPNALDTNTNAINYSADEEELRAQFEVYVIYDDGVPGEEPIEDYTICEYAYGDTSLTIEYTYQCVVNGQPVLDDENQPVTKTLTCYLNLLYEQDPTHEEKEQINIVEYLRFVDPETVDKDAELFQIIQDNKDAIEKILASEEAKALLAEAVQYECSWSDGIWVKVVFNSQDNKDLLALANLFLGIPSEEEEGGWKDVDADFFATLVGGSSQFIDVKTMFSTMVGVELNQFFSALEMYASITWQDGLNLYVQLDDGADTGYLVCGVNVSLVEPAEQIVVTEEMTQNAQGFDMLMSFAFSMLFGSMA